MKALLVFAAYSGMRPGELFALEWPDIDFGAMRIHVNRRVYKGRVGLPKSNKVRTIALTPPARAPSLASPPARTASWCSWPTAAAGFRSPTLSGYWGGARPRRA
jgi:hypothetical protein